jgi:hypothetical protein
MSEKIYVGNGKKKEFDNGGSIINVMINVDDFAAAYAKYGFKTTGGKNMIKLNIGSRRDPDDYGNTHYVQVDTWKPGEDNSGAAETAGWGAAPSVEKDSSSENQQNTANFEDDIPF